MSYIMILKQDELFIPTILDEFLSKVQNKPHSIYIVCKKDSKRYIKTSLKIISFSEKLKMSMQLLNSNINPFYKTLKKCLSKYNIPFKKIESVYDNGILNEMKGKQVKFILSFNSEIYSDTFLKDVGVKMYNFHLGFLPKYKGRFPMFWARLDKGKQGITCHEIATKIDGGAIIHQQEYDVPKKLKMMEIIELFVTYMGSFMVNSVDKIENNEPAFEAIEEKVSFFKYPTDSDIKKYKELRKLNII